MPLRSDWQQEAETPQLFERALVDRYATANYLLATGDWDAAIYFFGYVAELVLKSAYFLLLNNHNVAAPITLGPARRHGRQLIPNIDDEFYHSLIFWSELLRAERQDRAHRSQQPGQALPPAPPYNDADLVRHSRTLYHNWMVEMRYHPNRATEAEANQVAVAAKWMFDNRVNLGS